MSLTTRTRRAGVGTGAQLRILSLLFIGVALALAGCNATSTENAPTEGYSSTVALTTPVDPGAQCPAGGYQIDYGIDVNQNGTLDPGEVEGTAVVCNGATGGDGDEALVTATPLAAGEGGCAAGGYRLDFGLDGNGNGTLDSTEILSTSTVCNGADGLPGSSGSAGANALITSQTADPDDTCPAGGVVFSYGLDNGAGAEANNGELDADEVIGTHEVCNGQSPLVEMSDIAADDPLSPCGDYGGTRIDIGFDDGAGGGTLGNGELDGGEATVHNYLCAYGSGVSESGVALPLFQVHHGTVAATGTSVYQFTTGTASLDYRIRLSATDSLLSWALYTNYDPATGALTGAVGTPCAPASTAVEDVACVTDTRLAGNGTTYYVAVTELSNVPDLFDIVVRDNPRIVVTDESGYFYEVDPFTGEIETDPEFGDPVPLSPAAATPAVYGFSFILGDPATGYLYAMTDGELGYPAVNTFYRVDPFTLSAQVVELKDSNGDPFDNVNMSIERMAIDPKSGLVFAWVLSGDPTYDLYTVNLDPDSADYGKVLLYSTAYEPIGDIMSMSFDGSGNLYLLKYNNSSTSKLWMIDIDAEESNELGDASLVSAGGNTYWGSVNSLVVRPEDGRLLFANEYEGTDFYALHAGSLFGASLGPFNQTAQDPRLANLGLSTPIPPQPSLVFDGAGSGYIGVLVLHYRVAEQQNLYWSDQPGIDPANPSTYLGQMLDLDYNANNYEAGYYSVSLDGVYPSTTYYFLTTAVLEDGTVVPSRVLTVTPPAAPAP